MADWVSGDFYLNDEQQRNNAQIIADYFHAYQWDARSVAAMLGNMEVESTINPGKWQRSGDTSSGYGLVQWTPATKLIEWAETQGLDYTQGDTQLERILWELINNEQWVATSNHNISFSQFAYNTQDHDVAWLSDAWCYCYERPSDPDIDLRRANSLYWYEIIKYGTAHRVWLLFKIREFNFYRR